MNARNETFLFAAIGALFAFLTIAVPVSLAWNDESRASVRSQIQAQNLSPGAAAACQKIPDMLAAG